MRHRLPIVVFIVLAAATAHAAAPHRIATAEPQPTWLAIQPALRRDSLLQRWRSSPAAASTRKTFSLRTTVDSSREVVRLVDDDAGIAYVGAGAHAEPEVAADDLLPPLEPPPPEPGLAPLRLTELAGSAATGKMVF